MTISAVTVAVVLLVSSGAATAVAVSGVALPGQSMGPGLPSRPTVTASPGTATAGAPAAAIGRRSSTGGLTATRIGWSMPMNPAHVLRGFSLGPMRWSPGHRGVDLEASPGQRVRAPVSGRVTYSGIVAGVPVVVIAVDRSVRTTLEPVVAGPPVGTRVRRGDAVGLLGPQAGHCAPTACLHWGVLEGLVYVDPLTLVRGDRPVVLLPVLPRVSSLR